VSDVALPGTSSSEVAATIKKIHPRAGVLYISGFIDGPLGQRAARTTGARFLQKPLTPKTLTREVEELIRESAANENSV
jgi:FixJ family two-component response regulator